MIRKLLFLSTSNPFKFILLSEKQSKTSLSLWFPELVYVSAITSKPSEKLVVGKGNKDFLVNCSDAVNWYNDCFDHDDLNQGNLAQACLESQSIWTLAWKMNPFASSLLGFFFFFFFISYISDLQFILLVHLIPVWFFFF